MLLRPYGTHNFNAAQVSDFLIKDHKANAESLVASAVVKLATGFNNAPSFSSSTKLLADNHPLLNANFIQTVNLDNQCLILILHNYHL